MITATTNNTAGAFGPIDLNLGIPENVQGLLKAIHKHCFDDLNRSHLCSMFLVHESSEAMPYGVRIFKAVGSYMVNLHISNKWLFESLSSGKGLQVIDESMLDKYSKALDVATWAHLALSIGTKADEQEKRYFEGYESVLRIFNDAKAQVIKNEQVKKDVFELGFNVEYLAGISAVFEKALLADDSAFTNGDKKRAKQQAKQVKLGFSDNKLGGLLVRLLENEQCEAILMPLRIKKGGN